MLHAEESAADVDGHDRVERCHVGVADADHGQGRAGVVDEAVHLAEAGERLRNHGLDVVLPGDVGPNEADAEPPFERRAFGLAAGRGDDFRRFLDEDFRDFFADPAGRAEDDGDLAAPGASGRDAPSRSTSTSPARARGGAGLSATVRAAARR